MAEAALPDAVRIVVDHLEAAALPLIGARVYGFDLPANPTFPAVRVSRFGGTNVVNQRLDGARVQIEVLGGTDEQAWDATASVRAELWDMEGTTGATGTVTGIEELSGPAWLPDPRTERARWTWDIRLYAHP
jgi:hypothetical protein